MKKNSIEYIPEGKGVYFKYNEKIMYGEIKSVQVTNNNKIGYQIRHSSTFTNYGVSEDNILSKAEALEEVCNMSN